MQLNPDSKLKDIVGWDSMNAVNLLAELEKTFGVNLENETLRESMTLADVARLVEAHGGKCGDM